MAVNHVPVTLSAYGVSMCLGSCEDPFAVEALPRRARALGWTEAAVPRADLEYACTADDGVLRLRCNGETVTSAYDRDALVDAFDNHLKIELALRAPHHVFVHAGVVGWRGGAIVIPGRSRAGKTTLVEALVRAGADYYSDEFAVLDADGRVHPYAIPLAIRAPGRRAAVPVDALGGRAGTVPLPVDRIVITTYQPSARWRPRTISPALGLLALMDNTVAAQQAPEKTMPVLRRAVERAQLIRSRRGGAGAVADALLGATG